MTVSFPNIDQTAIQNKKFHQDIDAKTYNDKNKACFLGKVRK